MKQKFRLLELTAKTMINSFGCGSHSSQLKDSTIDVDVVRTYQPGDKKLDSRSSLRTSQTMSRIFIPDKVMTVFLILDISASMHSKLEQAITTCLYLSYLTDMASDQIGLLTFSDEKLVLPNHDIRSVTSILEKIYERDMLSGTTNLEQALLRLGGLELNNTLVVLVSDFCYSVSDNAIRLAKRVSYGQNNKMIGLVLVNNQEWHMDQQPFAVDFMDAESKASVWWNFRKKQDENDWLSEVKMKLRQAKIEPIVMSVDKNDYLMPLVRYLL